MRETISGMIENEASWIGGLAAIGAVIGTIVLFCTVIYMWFSFPSEFPWYGWMALVFIGTVGGALVGTIAGIGLYLAIVFCLGMALAGLILGGIGLALYILLLLFGMA